MQSSKTGKEQILFCNVVFFSIFTLLQLLEYQRIQLKKSAGPNEKNAVAQIRKALEIEKMKKEKLKLEETLQVSKQRRCLRYFQGKTMFQGILTDERSKFIELKGLKEQYENQIKNIKRGWEKRVKKLVSKIKLLICSYFMISFSQNFDIVSKDRKLKTSENQIMNLVAKNQNERTIIKVSVFIAW